jgi:hypothetical protein
MGEAEMWGVGGGGVSCDKSLVSLDAVDLIPEKKYLA